MRKLALITKEYRQTRRNRGGKKKHTHKQTTKKDTNGFEKCRERKRKRKTKKNQKKKPKNRTRNGEKEEGGAEGVQKKRKKEEKKQHFNDVVMVNCGARVYRKPRRAGDRGSRCTNSTPIKRSPK